MMIKSSKYNYGSQTYETIQMISYHPDASLAENKSLHIYASDLSK